MALAFEQLGGRQYSKGTRACDIESNLNAQRQYSYHLDGAPITLLSLARLNRAGIPPVVTGRCFTSFMTTVPHMPQARFPV
ncbi:MAG: hypothetical protein ABL933_19375 [Methyloglobulus sp.]